MTNLAHNLEVATVVPCPNGAAALVEHAPLKAALARVKRTVERRSRIAILCNVRLRADGGALRLTTTDLDRECDYRIPGAVDSHFDVTAPAHMLADIIAKAKGCDAVALDIRAGGGAVNVDTGGPVASVFALPSHDWPKEMRSPWTNTFVLSAEQVRQLFGRTVFAISTEETRYYLNGVFLHVSGGGRLNGVATDGHRLAHATIDTPEGAEGMPGVIVPAAAVKEVIHAFTGKKAPASVTVRLNENRIQFEAGPLVYTSKLIDGTFPAYDRVIPAGNDKIMRVNRDEFAALVEQVTTISSERGRAIKFTLCPLGVTGSVINPDSGTTKGELVLDEEAEGFTGEMDIGFNGRYLLDICGSLGERIEMRFADPGTPALFLDMTDPTFRAVCMPMRV